MKVILKPKEILEKLYKQNRDFDKTKITENSIIYNKDKLNFNQWYEIKNNSIENSVYISRTYWDRKQFLTELEYKNLQFGNKVDKLIEEDNK